jgi:hypothetical protein
MLIASVPEQGEERTGKRVPRCYDNQGETFDRYTIVIGESVYTMSHNALSPQGVNMYCCQVGEVEITDPEIEFSFLPSEVQEAVRRRVESHEETGKREREN